MEPTLNPSNSTTQTNNSSSLPVNQLSNPLYGSTFSLPSYNLPNFDFGSAPGTFTPPPNFSGLPPPPALNMDILASSPYPLDTATLEMLTKTAHTNFPPAPFVLPSQSSTTGASNPFAIPQGIPSHNTTSHSSTTPMPPPQTGGDHEAMIRKNLSGRRSSIPFSFMSGPLNTSSSPISSASSTSGGQNAWQDAARARHTHSLIGSVSVGVAASCGRRQNMEDEFLVVPFKGGENSSSSGSIPKMSLGEIPLPSSLVKKRRPSMTSISEETLKKLKASENSSPSQPESNSAASASVPAPEKKKPAYAFFAVYDGHGGNSCAEYVRMNLHSNISNHDEFSTDVEKAITEGFNKTEKEYAEENGKVDCGTTACVALIYENILYVANVGDSAGVLCRGTKAVSLSTPHTLKTPSEKKRIEELGGVILGDRLAHPHLNPKMFSIAVTRAIGDLMFKDEQFTAGKPSGLVAVPEIKKFTLTHEDKFILLATDGFWDQMTEQEAVDFVLKKKSSNPKIICRELTDIAAKKSNIDCLDDNATVVLVKLKENFDDVKPKEETVTPVVNNAPELATESPSTSNNNSTTPPTANGSSSNLDETTNPDKPLVLSSDGGSSTERLSFDLGSRKSSTETKVS